MTLEPQAYFGFRLRQSGAGLASDSAKEPGKPTRGIEKTLGALMFVLRRLWCSKRRPGK